MNSSDNVFTVLYQLLETLLLPFIPIYISIYTFFWIKAGTKFNLLFTTVNTQVNLPLKASAFFADDKLKLFSFFQDQDSDRLGGDGDILALV